MNARRFSRFERRLISISSFASVFDLRLEIDSTLEKPFLLVPVGGAPPSIRNRFSSLSEVEDQLRFNQAMWNVRPC